MSDHIHTREFRCSCHSVTHLHILCLWGQHPVNWEGATAWSSLGQLLAAALPSATSSSYILTLVTWWHQRVLRLSSLLSFFSVCTCHVGVFPLRKSSWIFEHLMMLFQLPSICNILILISPQTISTHFCTLLVLTLLWDRVVQLGGIQAESLPARASHLNSMGYSETGLPVWSRHFPTECRSLFLWMSVQSYLDGAYSNPIHNFLHYLRGSQRIGRNRSIPC